jgi:citrate lyase synthetase
MKNIIDFVEFVQGANPAVRIIVVLSIGAFIFSVAVFIGYIFTNSSHIILRKQRIKIWIRGRSFNRTIGFYNRYLGFRLHRGVFSIYTSRYKQAWKNVHGKVFTDIITIKVC